MNPRVSFVESSLDAQSIPESIVPFSLDADSSLNTRFILV